MCARGEEAGEMSDPHPVGNDWLGMIDHGVVPWLEMSSVCSVEKLLEPHHPLGYGECWHSAGADGQPAQ